VCDRVQVYVNALYCRVSNEIDSFLRNTSAFDALALEGRQNGTEMGGEVNVEPVKSFPIKKRINTELFIHGDGKLYIQK